MKTDQDHLPETKKRELARIVEILFAEFEAAIAGSTMPYKRKGAILKIILFGSYARGDWVSDPIGGYISDYDLLVVVNDDKLTDITDNWSKAEDHLLREYGISHRLTAPASFIVHSLNDVNQQLRLGRYFFTDIVRDGIVLYEREGHTFAHPETLAPAEALKEAQGYFDEWYETAGQFLVNGTENTARGWGKIAAFDLHQATERLYHCVLLVVTLYSAKSHKLNFLRSQAEQLDARLIGAWPRRTKFEQRCFELLRRAYVDARYSPHYKITTEELTWLGERVTILQDSVKAICEKRLVRLRIES